MILAIDFDGTIHDYLNPVEGRTMGRPIEGAKEALRLFKEAGYTIVIYTVRGDRPAHVAEWMRYYDIPFDHIEKKMLADIYIDDRGLHFTNWKETTLRVVTDDPEARFV